MERRTARVLFWFFFALALILSGVNAKCGDGQLDGGEQCDDGGKVNGDGCSANCQREVGWNCTGQPSVCNTTCGDGIKAGTEQCDDGNTNNNDNCTTDCKIKESSTSGGSGSVNQGHVNPAPIIVPIILVMLAVGGTLIVLTIKKHRPETWEKITSVFKRQADPDASFYATPGRTDEEAPKQNTDAPPEKHSTVQEPKSAPSPVISPRSPQASSHTPLIVPPPQPKHQTTRREEDYTAPPPAPEPEPDYTAPPPAETPRALPAVGAYDSKSQPSDRFFGVPIQSCRQINNIPAVVETCISFLEQHGLQEEGLLRLAGSASQIKQLKEQFDTGGQPNLSQFDLHSVAGVLKLYFRELPKVPLIATQGLKDALCARDRRLFKRNTDVDHREHHAGHGKVEEDFSIQKPFVVSNDELAGGKWKFAGDASVTGGSIKLTGAIKNRRGMVYNTMPYNNDEWEIVTTLRYGGGGKNGGDGFGIWYTEQTGVQGSLYGGPEIWKGLAIFIDTYDNDGKENTPLISVWMNDGTRTVDQEQDGEIGSLAYCAPQGYQRTPNVNLKLKIVYSSGKLSVFVENMGKSTNMRAYEPCITNLEVALPETGYFMVSASTNSFVYDNHDLYTFKVIDLVDDDGHQEAEDSGVDTQSVFDHHLHKEDHKHEVNIAAEFENVVNELHQVVHDNTILEEDMENAMKSVRVLPVDRKLLLANRIGRFHEELTQNLETFAEKKIQKGSSLAFTFEKQTEEMNSVGAEVKNLQDQLKNEFQKRESYPLKDIQQQVALLAKLLDETKEGFDRFHNNHNQANSELETTVQEYSSIWKGAVIIFIEALGVIFYAMVQARKAKAARLRF